LRWQRPPRVSQGLWHRARLRAGGEAQAALSAFAERINGVSMGGTHRDRRLTVASLPRAG
ncbi:hypothetical protein ACE4ZV_26995, partial [Salmonella enterica]|uniref:hypothetical protein n=1 Tax=Salmonella enterica TaxID=28901 RepID=UPI003D2E5F9D